MATDFTQDAVLHFLHSSGGSVKNSELLLHFRTFIKDHADRNRNRELFKKFVNSVATVKQVDGVSYVVLRKKYKGYVAGGGEGGSSDAPRLPVGKNVEPSPENASLSPAWSSEKPRQKPPQKEGTTPAPPGAPAGKTILPAAGIILNNNNNNVESNLNLKQRQVISTPGLSGRPAAAQVVRSEVKPPSLSEPPAPDQCPAVGQHRVGSGSPPVVAALRRHGETSQQVPETLRGREACLQPEGGLHQEPPLHRTSPQLQAAPRRIRHRQSYKSAVSYDDDEQEEEDEVQMKGGSAEGAGPLSSPLRDTGRVISASTPCIIDPPAPPSVTSSSSSTSSERKLPKIYVQDLEVMPPGGPGWSSGSGAGQRGQRAGSELETGSVPGESKRAEEVVLHQDAHVDRRYSQPAGVQLKPGQGPSQSQGAWLSASHGNIVFPSSDAGFSSSDWLLRSSRSETRGRSEIQEALQRAQEKKESVTHPVNSKTTAPWHHSTGNLHDDQEPKARVPPFHHSTDHLHDDQEPKARVLPFHHSTDHLHDDQGSTARLLPWHRSTGDLCDDREEVESSKGSTSSPPLRLRPAVARRLSSQLRSRMCRSLGTDLDQLLQEQARVAGGSEAARLNRLHMISSSLSLRYNLSSSSLSSCSTPPRCHSFADLAEGVEGKGERRSSHTAASSSAHQEGSNRQSLVPLEPREHAWLVKGALGAWPDIYALFREDTSLLNRQDFISGFTILHWIAKHGDHRVLNTLWYGVQKAGLTFDLNAKSTCGYTPLHIAAIHGNRNIMQLLVNKFNADVKLRDTAGKKPWQYLSHNMPPDVFQLLGAPARRPAGEGGEDPSWEQPQQRHRRRRHHLSFASSGERPLTVAGTTRVKRSTSIAAFLKHKSMRRLHGHQSDSWL